MSTMFNAYVLAKPEQKEDDEFGAEQEDDDADLESDGESEDW